MYKLEELCIEHDEIMSNIFSYVFRNDYKSPDAIYHYTSSENITKIVQKEAKGQLIFTQYDCLNDCNERNEFFEFLYKYCDFKVKDGIFSQEYCDRIKTVKASDIALVTSFGETDCVSCVVKECYTYLCCFSKDPDSLAMWNYYTKSQHYEGYCVGFHPNEFNIINNIGEKYDISLKEVVYSNSAKEKILDRVLTPWAGIYDESSNEKKDAIIEFLNTELQNYQFIFKNRCFEHEKEVRAILRIPKDFDKNSKISERMYRSSNGYIKPFIKYNVSPNMIYSITLPPLSKDEIATKNLEDFLVNLGHNNVRIFSSSVPVRF